MKYKFLYIAAEGDFQITITAGHTLYAKDFEHAMKLAAHMDEYVLPEMNYSIMFHELPSPCVFIKYDKSKSPMVPAVVKYEILQNKNPHKEIMGFPVYSDEDFLEVGEEKFLRLVAEHYKAYFQRNNRHTLSFEIISFGVVPD